MYSGFAGVPSSAYIYVHGIHTKCCVRWNSTDVYFVKYAGAHSEAETNTRICDMNFILLRCVKTKLRFKLGWYIVVVLLGKFRSGLANSFFVVETINTISLNQRTKKQSQHENGYILFSYLWYISLSSALNDSFAPNYLYIKLIYIRRNPRTFFECAVRHPPLHQTQILPTEHTTNTARIPSLSKRHVNLWMFACKRVQICYTFAAVRRTPRM